MPKVNGELVIGRWSVIYVKKIDYEQKGTILFGNNHRYLLARADIEYATAIPTSISLIKSDDDGDDGGRHHNILI